MAKKKEIKYGSKEWLDNALKLEEKLKKEGRWHPVSEEEFQEVLVRVLFAKKEGRQRKKR